MATIWIDALIFGPVYALGIYAFIRGREWIRLPAIIASAILWTNVTIILSEKIWGAYATLALVHFSLYHRHPVVEGAPLHQGSGRCQSRCRRGLKRNIIRPPTFWPGLKSRRGSVVWGLFHTISAFALNKLMGRGARTRLMGRMMKPRR